MKGQEVVDAFWLIINKQMWLDNLRMKEELSDFKSSEIHLIAYVGKHEDPNVTQLADALNMTLGGVTKLAQKLVKKNLIRSYKKNTNKKEIYFELTEDGKKLFAIHEKLHEEFYMRDKEMLEKLPDDVATAVLKFADDYNAHLDKIIAETQRPFSYPTLEGRNT